MSGKPVSSHILITLGVEIIDRGLPPSTAHTTGTRDNDTAWIKESLPEKRDERQLDTCRVTTRAGDKRRGFDQLPRELRNRIDRLPQKLGSRMRSAIVIGIDLGFVQPEVSAQIDHDLVCFQERNRILGGHPMRQCQKNNACITGRHFGRLRFRKDQGSDLQSRETGHHLTHPLPLMLP